MSSGFIALPLVLLAALLFVGLIVTLIIVAIVSRRARSWLLGAMGVGLLILLLLGALLLQRGRRSVEVEHAMVDSARVPEAAAARPPYSVNVDDGRGNRVAVDKSGSIEVDDGRGNRVVVDKSRGIEVADSRGRKVSVSRTRSSDLAPTPPTPLSPLVEAETNWATFLADVYPSAETAAEALSREMLGKIWLYGEAPAGTTVRLSGGLDRQSLLRVAEKVRNATGAQTALGIDEIEAAVHKASPSLTLNLHGDAAKGATLEASWRGGDGNADTRSVKVVQTPWAADFAEFQRASRGYLLAQTPAPAAGAQEAYDAALKDAAGQLASMLFPRLVDELRRSPARPRNSQTVAIPQKVALAGMIVEDLRRGRAVRDGFAQTFERPYGKLYRQMLLVDCSEQTLQELARPIAQRLWSEQAATERAVEQQRWTWAKMVMSIAALVGLTILVYALLNAATKGYYSWVLRIVAVALIAGGILFVVIA